MSHAPHHPEPIALMAGCAQLAAWALLLLAFALIVRELKS
jgi:hypothetical protein